ncbi:MAG: hypothetical protein LBQ50_08130 [Planctomycetaceae bacterium]|nr:hypothetical protein [Planctomycetaceae bacterium]
MKTWSVEGTVSMNGQPLEEGMIRFRPKQQGNEHPAYGAIKKGYYKLQTSGGDFEAGAVPGDYFVTFSVLSVSQSDDPDAESVETLPKLYTETDTTPFSVTVVKGKNVFNFELQTNPTF